MSPKHTPTQAHGGQLTSTHAHWRLEFKYILLFSLGTRKGNVVIDLTAVEDVLAGVRPTDPDCTPAILITIYMYCV